MNKENSVVFKERVSASKKTKGWHIAMAEEIDARTDYSEYYHNKKVNYDLVNGILNQDDFEYITKPYGISPKAYLSEEMFNYPILTNYFKYLEGELLLRPENTRVYSTNPEALNEGTKVKGEMLSEYVINKVKMSRLQEAMANNPEITQEQMAELEQQIMSPEEIEKYSRSYRDSYETMAQEIYNILKEDQHLKEKDRIAWKHGITSGYELYYTGIVNKKPVVRVVNPLRFECEADPDLIFVHDAEWAKTKDYLTPSKVVSMFPDLTKAEIEKIYSKATTSGARRRVDNKWDIEADIDLGDLWGGDWDSIPAKQNNLIKVEHFVRRTWYKVGFLTYIDPETYEMQTMQVPEGYSLNKENGDVEIEWEWYPEIREITRIDDDIWTAYGAVEKFYENPDDPYDCPLPYTGVIHNNLNSLATSPVDLMKPFQYFANIVFRLIQRDISSDRGKKILANINQIPTSMGIDLEKWQHYLNVDDIIWVNPNEEGNRGNTDLTSWRSVDLTAAQSLDKKVQLLEYIDQQCGKVIGINSARLGQQGNRELVGTTQQQIMQSSYTTEPWFATHELGKKAMVTQLLNVAKYAYHKYGSNKFAYISSDLSKQIVELDVEKLPFLTMGVYVSSSSDDLRIYNELRNLAHAATQTQSATLSSIAKMIRGNATPGELIDTLEQGENRIQQIQQQNSEAERQNNLQIEQGKQQLEMLKLELEKYKAELDAEVKLKVAEINSFKFVENQDVDGNSIPDQLEIEKFKLDADTKMRELELKADELSRKLSVEEEKNRLKEKEIESKERIEELKAKTALKNKVSGEK